MIVDTNPDVRSQPRVTVCIPVYNLAGYVAETLDSVLHQTYCDYEVIIVDDGSTDDTAAAVEPYLDDHRFKYVFQENTGLGLARNTALNLASGEWFALLDGDDVWLPDKLACQMTIADSDPSANLLYTDRCIFFDDNSEPERRYFVDITMREGDITEWICEQNHLPASSVIVKTDDLRAVGGFPDLRRCEDWVTWLKLVRRGVRARACNEPLLRYRVRSGSLSSSKLEQLECGIRARQSALDTESSPRLAKILKRCIRRLQAEVALTHMRESAAVHDTSFEEYLWQWWIYEPLCIKRLLRGLQCSVSKRIGIDMGRKNYMDRVAGN